MVGVGARRGVPHEVVFALIEAALSAAGLDPADVAEVATVDAKGDEPGIVGAAARLGVPVRTHPAGALAAVRVPHPSDAAGAAVGTPSVAEAAALIDADELVVPKTRAPGGAADGGRAPGRGGRDLRGGPAASGRRRGVRCFGQEKFHLTGDGGPPSVHHGCHESPPRTSRAPGPTCGTTATRRCAARI